MFHLDEALETEARYDIAKFCDFQEDVLDDLTSYFILKLPSLPEGGTYLVSGEEHRPDLLSYNIYKNTQYWWPLLIYNGIRSTEDLIAGTTIRFPSIDSLEALYFQLVALSRALG